jgi:hypothetical protein
MILYIILIILIFYFINKLLSKEHFYITTWTPYVLDNQYQPGYSNYFYNNGYMYPIY